MTRLSGLNGDTIVDFTFDDRIIISDANFAGFSFSLSGNTLTFTGGSLTLASLPAGTITASAAAGGGVQLTIVEYVPIAIGGAVRAGDFNGDGRDDVLWRHDSGQVANWLGQANGGFVSATGANAGPDWEIAGTGDFNGDGREDILWRQDFGQVAAWLGQANGGFATSVGATVSTDWKIVGIGDFNGDGRDDILWRNGRGDVTDWLGRADGSFRGQFGQRLSPGLARLDDRRAPATSTAMAATTSCGAATPG